MRYLRQITWNTLDPESSIRQLRELRRDALKNNAWRSAINIGRVLRSFLLTRCQGQEREAARVARMIAREDATPWTLLELGEAEVRCGRLSNARRAYQRAHLLAVRAGELDVRDAASAGLASLTSKASPAGTTPTGKLSYRERKEAARSLPFEQAVEALLGLRTEAVADNGWAIEESLLTAIVETCHAHHDAAAETRYARLLNRTYPSALSWWMLGRAHVGAQHFHAARVCLRTGRTLALRDGDHDLVATIDEGLDFLERPPGS